MEALVNYSVGILVSPDGERVLLLQKARPSFMAGTWGPFGGHIERGETPLEAMIREANEEANLPVFLWTFLGVVNTRQKLDSPVGSAKIMMFAAFGNVNAARTMTDEPLEVFTWDQVAQLNLSETARLVMPQVKQFAQGRIEQPFTPPSLGSGSIDLDRQCLVKSIWGADQNIQISRARLIEPTGDNIHMVLPSLETIYLDIAPASSKARLPRP